MKLEVVAFPREKQGTGASRRLRTSGRVPGVIYGADKPAQAIEVDQNALLRHLKLEAFHSSILDMTVSGAKERVLLRDFQLHPWKPIALHVDFQRIDPNKKIHMRVPLHFMNQEIAPGVKLGGGVMQHVMNDIEVQCLPDALPEFIEVDLKELELGQAVHVQNLNLPAGVEISAKLRQDNAAVVILQVPREQAAEEAVAAPVTEITGQAPETPGAAGGAGEKKDEKKEEKKEGGK
jgi:large subunit ribosomal protein L25